MGFTAALTALFESLKELFKFKTVDTVLKPTKEIVKEKKALKKAADTTEKIIEITDKYVDLFDSSDKRKYKSLKKKFLKNN